VARPADRPLPTPAGDDGAVDPRVEAALADLPPDGAPTPRLVAALASGRLLVPVVAVLEEAEARGGHRTDKASHLASVSTTGRDGRRGQLAFTSLGTMRRWDPAARPVPVAARGVAAAALSDGADAVVVDLAGPVVVELDGPLLRALAAGWEPVDDEDGATRWGVHVALAHPEEPPERERPGAVRRTWWRRAPDRQ
jgi:SseB protein N-terminal domain